MTKLASVEYYSSPYTFTSRDLVAIKRDRQMPGDRKLHAPERKRRKRLAKKLAMRSGAQHYRDAGRCAEMQKNQRARPGKLERAMLDFQRQAHDDKLDALTLWGTGGDIAICESKPPRYDYFSNQRFGVPIMKDTAMKIVYS